MLEPYERLKENKTTDFGCPHAVFINCNAIPYCEVYKRSCDAKKWKMWCPIYNAFAEKIQMEV